MKYFLRSFVVLVALQLISCEKEEGLSKREKNLLMLTESAWGNATVTNDPDGDVTSQYEGFTIAFTKNVESGFDGSYAISNGGYAFSETSGKWKFNKELTTITLDSGKEMNFELSEGDLMLNFYVVSSNGRGLSGEFTFDLSGI